MKQPPFFKLLTPEYRNANRLLKKSVAKNCALLLGVSEPITDYFGRLTPK